MDGRDGELGDDVVNKMLPQLTVMSLQWFVPFPYRNEKLQLTMVGEWTAVYFPFYHALVYFDQKTSTAHAIKMSNFVMAKRNQQRI